jgi:hypothetical protein
MNTEQSDLGFTFHLTKSGHVLIERDGKRVTILRGKPASNFISKMDKLEFDGQQQWMARVTGNYKRGNEHNGRNHPRNQ